MNTRLLGWAGILGALIAIVDSIRLISLNLPDTDTISTIAVGLCWSVGVIATLAGMIRLGVVGTNTVARALTFVPMIGFVLVMIQSVLSLSGVQASELASIAWLVQLVGMLLVGITTIAAKVWRGWARFVPLLCVVLVPAAYGLGAAAGNLFYGAPFAYGAYAVLGYLVASTAPAPTTILSAA